MIETLTDLSKMDIDQLETFVCLHPHGNFFQSIKAFRFFQATNIYEPFLIVAVENGEIVGSLLSVSMREGGGLKGYFSRRCIVWGGPLVNAARADVYSELLKKFNEINGRMSIYTQFRNFFDLTDVEIEFHDQGWQSEEHLNIIIDLSKTEEELWKGVHSKRRNEIRRAEKEGTCFRVLETRDELDETYDILKEVYDRAKLPLPRIHFFKTAYDVLGTDEFKIFLAVNGGKIIGTMYVLCFNGMMYDWYAGSYRVYYKKYPNDLIPWKAFLWGKENGFKTFDFGGAGKPGVPYGVRDYKKKFGGEFVNYGRFEKIHKPLLYQFGKLGLKAWQKLK
ncbi:MAG: aminoacyltransferase [Desulfobacterales bacterium]|nr:aminoacyltransferase [Desulfobacterales bacterium]